MEVNEEKRQKFIEYAGKRVNNVMHDIQILEPMSRSNSYDYTKQDLEEMFTAMQECLNQTKEEFYKKFAEKEAKAARKTFSFGTSNTVAQGSNTVNTTTAAGFDNANTVGEQTVTGTTNPYGEGITETTNSYGEVTNSTETL